MFSSLRDSCEKHRYPIAVAAAAVAGGAFLLSWYRSDDQEQQDDENSDHCREPTPPPIPLEGIPALSKRLRALVSAPAAAGGGGGDDGGDSVLIALDSRFQNCVAVFLPEDHAAIVASSRSTTAAAEILYPAVLANPAVQYLTLPRRIFVGAPPPPQHQQVPSSSGDGGGMEEGLTADFSVLEPHLPPCLAAHGLTQERWTFSVTFFLRFPTACICHAELVDRTAAAGVGGGAGGRTTLSSPLTMNNLKNLDGGYGPTVAGGGGGGGGGAETASNTGTSRLSSSAAPSSVAASNFFAMPSLVLSPEQELDRFLGLNCVLQPVSNVKLCSSNTGASPPPVQKTVLLPASMRVGQVLPRVLHEAIQQFVVESAAALSQKTRTRNALQARNVAISFEQQIRVKVMNALPGKLFAEAGVRCSDVSAMRGKKAD